MTPTTQPAAEQEAPFPLVKRLPNIATFALIEIAIDRMQENQNGSHASQEGAEVLQSLIAAKDALARISK